MDEAEKRRLKKLGKRQVEEESRALQQQMKEANPAALGSAEWVANYKKGVQREQGLRQSPPDRISEADALRDFVVHRIPNPRLDIGATAWYAQCAKCRDFVHTHPPGTATCQCGAVSLWLSDDTGTLQGRYRESDLLDIVRLIGRGVDSVDKKPWWKFW